jgi:hypothetical protein
LNPGEVSITNSPHRKPEHHSKILRKETDKKIKSLKRSDR